MGTTVSSLQILGASLEDVRAALPRALVGQWSARFVTACPNLSPRNAERQAQALSQKLDCTLLFVSMFDGDALWLTLYERGKRLTGHTALPESCKVGNVKLFCTALGLSEELAPKLKRLFTDCIMQEEKLGILESLLGTPLFIRYGDKAGELPEGPLEADSGPLEDWLREHSEPPKLKNQYQAQLLQEIVDRHPEYGQDTLVLRPAVRQGDPFQGWYAEHRAGDILGYAGRGGEWARPLPDGHMELVPLGDADVESDFDNHGFSCLGDRLVMTIHRYGPDPSGYPGALTPVQTVVVQDTAGILPCPLSLTTDGEPAVADHLWPLPDGGFLAVIRACFDDSRPPVKLTEELLVCYGPDGAPRWTVPGIDHVYQVTEQRIYAANSEADNETDREITYLLALNLNGTILGKYRLPESPYGTKVRILDGRPFVESGEYRADQPLYRLTPDLQPDGEVRVPYMSSLALSPDGTLLYAAGFQSGLRVIDAESLRTLRDLPGKDGFHSPVVDGQNRLWVANSGCFECYTPELECISRHRLKGSVYQTYRNDEGQACALTFQLSKYTLRVYRFS